MTSLCIHGHFYQPPREDPWLDEILPEGSAAPFLHWNERIVRESYSPLSCARRMDEQGRIEELVNCYEWMSFNVGPTLLGWLKRNVPKTYERIREADRASLERLGHGNAMAQIQHHVIMPLAKERDKRAEVAWAVSDFQAHFGRDPEGMWLSEAAVDTPTLEVLAEAGVRFTVLAPSQARAVAGPGEEAFREVGEGDVDIREPHRVDLPSGRSMAVFFYNGPVSQSVAFENLLADGEVFWRRIVQSASRGLLSLATDGETYGHHFHFGDMALAYVLAQARSGRDGVQLTNFAAYLAKNPPRRRVKLREPSSWSCVHGVERWRSDCGCTTGGHPGWTQQWREPLRRGLDGLKAELDEHFDAAGQEIFRDPDQALLGYGRVLAGLEAKEDFARSRFREGLGGEEIARGFALLSMQQWGLAMYASCAWFFDDLARLEPVNAMTFALRALELLRKTGGADVEARLREVLAQGASNDEAWGTGLDIWENEIVPRRETPASLAGQAVLRLVLEDRLGPAGRRAAVRWNGVEVLVARGKKKRGQDSDLHGEAEIRWVREGASERVRWRLEDFDPAAPLECAVRVAEDGAEGEAVFRPGALPWSKRQALAVAWAESADADAWEAGLRRAAGGLRLYLPFREGQTEQTSSGSWRAMAPWLTWLWIESGGEGLPAREPCEAFLREWTRDHGGPVLSTRVSARLESLLRQSRPDFAAAEAMLGRARELGVEPDLWRVQNAWWPHQGAGEGSRRLGRLLGFRVEGGM